MLGAEARHRQRIPFTAEFIQIVQDQSIDRRKGGTKEYGAALAAIRAETRDPATYLGFVEVHIEQGPVLNELDLPLGVVTSINGGVRFQCEVTGMASHAGTTPMNLRRDAAAAVHAAEQGGRRPEEGDLLRLADAQLARSTGEAAGILRESLRPLQLTSLVLASAGVARSEGSCGSSGTPSTPATTSAVRSSSVGPMPPDMTTASARPQHSATAAARSPRSSPTSVLRRTWMPRVVPPVAAGAAPREAPSRRPAPATSA